MAGVKGRSGGHNKLTLNEMQVRGERKSRLPKNPPDQIGDRIAKIEGLGEIGQKMFEYYEPMLYNNGTIDTTDAIAFHLLCKTYQDWYNAAQEIIEKGRYYDVFDKDGVLVEKKIGPWVKDEQQLAKQLKDLCREFGLTPVSRSNVEKISRGKSLNPFGGITK